MTNGWSGFTAVAKGIWGAAPINESRASDAVGGAVLIVAVVVLAVVVVSMFLGPVLLRKWMPRDPILELEKALEVDPRHAPTLRAIIELASAANDWRRVVRAQRALVEITPDGDSRFALWTNIGRLHAGEVLDRDAAAAAYLAALALRPEDAPVLRALFELYLDWQRWEEAITMIDRLVAVEKDPDRRARYQYTAAVLLRDKLRQCHGAVERLNLALDEAPHNLRWIEEIETMLTRAKDWRGLERSYAKMLARLPAVGQEPLEIILRRKLADLHRTRLRDCDRLTESPSDAPAPRTDGPVSRR